MRILFDNNTPCGLARELHGHDVTEARARGWDKLENGDLPQAAEEAGFEMLNARPNIRYQQNLAERKIALVVPGQGRCGLVKRHSAEIAAAVDAATSGSYRHVRSNSHEALDQWKSRTPAVGLGGCSIGGPIA
jgi:hypothetical protein